MPQEDKLILEKLFIQALENHKKKNFHNAKNIYKEVLKKDPFHLKACFNLAILYNNLGNFQKSIIYYEKVLEIKPHEFNACYNLGNIYKKLKKNDKAKKLYKKVIELQPKNIAALNNLGNLSRELGEYQNAIRYFKELIKIKPNFAIGYYNLGHLLKEIGEYHEAIEYFDKAVKIEPKNLIFQWQSMITFPVIYKNFEEIELSRTKFKKKIKVIDQLLNSENKYTKYDLENTINSGTNFFLHYQGKDDLSLQKQFANLIEQITQKVYPQFNIKIKKKKLDKKISVGFISSFFRDHTVSKLFKNWILKLDDKKFDKFTYYVSNNIDHVTQKIKNNSKLFFSENVEELISQISADSIDVIIYLDIGMEPKIQILSSLRLASLQFNTWGHPVTSGFKNIDFFLSSELMEANDSKKYFSEKLIKMPQLGIDYDFPDLSNTKEPELSKSTKSTIFLNLQSLFKLLPQDDHIYLDIIKKNPNCYFWFIEGIKDPMNLVFKDRISKRFQDEGYDFKKYFYFHPRCSNNEFLGLIKKSDIILDSLNWSGGNTSLEAISLNKPIITLPSNFMRGRHTYGILKILGIEETIANSKKNYIEIALKLASDINFRNEVIKKIKINKKKLFNNEKSVTFLEKVITSEYYKKNNIKVKG
ncbi:O-linked N-acetylglucosamine transferase, SPINDLY family protein [Candidatus Pelagibacter sp. HIMB1321]|uniref:O-linked N-acetylglucosamine transferase, SPINDLY family protein n=1 Tax=Candidatus Pelagibacter sp. HIMB1321 TaxID=1388755 RepID=UPI000A07ECFA|nr:tetratricopeptide repeat protein [Candidatus Pelagibacter sp. HIMB1321]SMF81488.1 Predicted O-linked N-acetylglucosamine transferase, SPINDLY family [Candidatus Pelagibacter sp. HIMB1321]